jgi:anthranilate phosphoribosyltransferase
VLEALGVRIELEPDQVAASVAQLGIGFCFAPMHHPAMRHAVPVRKQLGVPTVFNLLGPLSNPAGARAALVGCASEKHAPVMAEVLALRGVMALVVRGDDGLDEISIAGRTSIWDTTSGTVTYRSLDVRDVGLEPRGHDVLSGGDAQRNASLLEQVFALSPVEDPDKVAAIADAVVLNAAGGLVAYDAAVTGEPIRTDADLIERMNAAVGRARGALPDAGQLLRRWQRATWEL